ATGRLASHGPNLQNIPVRTDVGRQIRQAFVAPPCHRLICADYSQVELRLLAHLSEDEALLAAFQADHDTHAAVAAEGYGVPLAINSVGQGSAADLSKIAMVNVQRRIDRDRLPMKLLLQIHDELVLETPSEAAERHAAIVREEMERAMELRVPLKADAGIGED